MPRLRSFARLFALMLGLSLPPAAKAAEVQDIHRLFRQGELHTALARANRFLAENPRDAQVRFLKGLILTDLGKSAEAIQVFTALTEDYPELPEPYNNLAVLYAAEGRHEAAKHALEMAIRAHPGYATAHENLGDLYARMASLSYDKALRIDGTNQAARTKLALIQDVLSGSRPAPVGPEAVAPAAGKAAAPGEDRPARTSTGEPAGNLAGLVLSWARAWSNRDLEGYLAHYSPDFAPPHMSRKEWVAKLRERILEGKPIPVTAADLQVRRLSANRAEVHIGQGTPAARILELELQDGLWQIVRESGG